MTQIESGGVPDESAMLSVERIEKFRESVILYDGSLVNHIRAEWFDPASWPGAPSAPGYSGGRGATLFIHCQGQDWVLRHYHRGGTAARYATDGFIWLGQKRARSFAEWRVLAWLHKAGLPAPRPVAARCLRRGILYSADLITVRIPDVAPLSTRLAQGPLDSRVWRAVGECVGKFHSAHVCHADLTAHNLQINSRDEIFLLDFDRGRIMSGNGAWQKRNLERLHRSLTKISSSGAAGFSAADWSALMEGYRSRCDRD